MQSTDDGHAENVLPSTKSRTLCKGFMSDLTDGFMSVLRYKVAEDDTLMIGLRNDYINVYYRGGSVMKLTRVSDGHYKPFFDPNYCKPSKTTMPDLPIRITNAAECSAWVAAIPTLKDVMNAFFAKHRRAEREFQQLVVWENNRSSVSNKSEYFITDIEYAISAHGTKLDMLGLKWRAKDDKTGSPCKPVLIEMKWGDGAYEGNAGIAEHLTDIKSILQDEKQLENIRATIRIQFEQLSALGMLPFKDGTSINVGEVPEVVFILANHQPRNAKLHKVLGRIKEPDNFDLHFFVASFSGYGMHEACMLNLTQFKNLVASFLPYRDQKQKPQFAL